jgi:hypothetical protein
MLIEFIQSNEMFQIIFQSGIILLALRFFFMAGIIFALIVVHLKTSYKQETGDYFNDRISHQSATSVILFQFFREKANPFLIKEVY